MEILNGTIDFKDWQALLGVQMGGLSARIGRRTPSTPGGMPSVATLGATMDLSIGRSKWAANSVCVGGGGGFEPYPNDAVGVYKESMHSAALTQMPLVVLLSCVASGKHLRDNLEPAPRKLRSGREKMELLTTASAVEQDPWYLHRAAASPRKLVALQGQPLPTIEFKFVHEHTTHTDLERGPYVMGVHYAPDNVRNVVVVASSKRTRAVSSKGEGKANAKAKSKARSTPKAKRARLNPEAGGCGGARTGR